MNTCDNCIEETDNVVCDECQEDAWETALDIGRKEGAAIAAGIIALGEWARRCGTGYRCLGCGHWQGELDPGKPCEGGNGYESHAFVEVDSAGMARGPGET